MTTLPPRIFAETLLVPRTTLTPAQLTPPTAAIFPGPIPAAGVQSGNAAQLYSAWFDVTAYAGVAIELVPVFDPLGITSAGFYVAAQYTDDPANVIGAIGNVLQYVFRYDRALGLPAYHRTYVRNRGRWLNLTIAQNGGMGATDRLQVIVTGTFADPGPDLSCPVGYFGSPETLVPMVNLPQVAVAAGASSTIDFHGGGPAVLNAWSATAGGGTYRALLAIYDGNGNRTTYCHEGVAAAPAGAHSAFPAQYVVIPPGTHRLQVVNTAGAAQQIGASLLLDAGLGA